MGRATLKNRGHGEKAEPRDKDHPPSSSSRPLSYLSLVVDGREGQGVRTGHAGGCRFTTCRVFKDLISTFQPICCATLAKSPSLSEQALCKTQFLLSLSSGVQCSIVQKESSSSIFIKPCENGKRGITIFITQMRKLRLRGQKRLAQDHTVCQGHS